MYEVKICAKSAVWLLMVASWGCSVDVASVEDGVAGPGEEAIDRSRTALVGGTATFARPAIGRLNGCTATLVDPSYVATAAHCFNYVSGNVSDNFTVFDTSGNVAASVPIYTAHSYGLWLGTDDFALARLDTPIPSSVATPVAFGAAPQTNQAVTAFGFGCTNRDTLDGWPVKRYVNYTFGGSTSMNCPGDSGGPRLHGQHNGTGSLWGINSGYSLFGGSDVNADATVVGPEGLRGAKAFGGSVETETTDSELAELANAAGVKAVSGDFDGDSYADVALVGGVDWSSVPVAFGNGQGWFTLVNLGLANFPAWATAARNAVAGDFDADGDTDIALLGGNGWNTIPIAFSNRDGTFTVSNLQTPDIPNWSRASGAYAVGGDFDGDGDGDIALLGGSGWTTIPIAFSNRNGQFTRTNVQVGSFPGYSRAANVKAAVADFDGDGDADIALAGGQQSNGTAWTTVPVAFSNRNGGFSVTNRTVPSFPQAAQSSPIVAGDFDGDGDGDLAAIADYRAIHIALSARNGTFVPSRIPVGGFMNRAAQARFAFAARIDWGSEADLLVVGGESLGGVHGVVLRKPWTP